MARQSFRLRKDWKWWRRLPNNGKRAGAEAVVASHEPNGHPRMKKGSTMKRSFLLIVAVALVAGMGIPEQSRGQQVGQPAAPARVSQPTRSYRSYSVNPTNPPRGDVRRGGRHSGEATWRHAGAKPVGHYNTGR